MSIHFNFVELKDNITQKQRLKTWIKNTIVENGKKIGEITYIFCNDEYLLSINQEYLKHNYYTDIITFDYSDDSKIAGDMFISLDRVKENAQSLSLDFEIELYRVMIHGILHLLGHKDTTPEQEKKMRKLEDKCLKNMIL